MPRKRVMSKEKLAADLRVVIADAEELLKATAAQQGEKINAVRTRVEGSLDAARSWVVELEQAAGEKAKRRPRPRTSMSVRIRGRPSPSQRGSVRPRHALDESSGPRRAVVLFLLVAAAAPRAAIHHTDRMERVLAVFAHPDDEASCVGTLANHSDAGDAVRLLWLSRGENTTALRMDREAKIRERGRQAEQVGALLGVETGFLDFPDAGIVHTRENALVVADVIRAWKPTILLTWNLHRAVGAGHPDHRNTHAIVLDAVRTPGFPWPRARRCSGST